MFTSLANFYPLPLAIWIAAGTAYIIGGLFFSAWNGILSVTGIALSMTVNALVMSLIVFRIIKVFRDVNPTSYERFLGTTHGSRLRSMIFVLIESGMILFSIQLVRLVLVSLEDWAGSLAVFKAYPLIFAIHEMFNVIIKSDISPFYFADNVAILGYNTYNHPGASVNGILFPR